MPEQLSPATLEALQALTAHLELVTTALRTLAGQAPTVNVVAPVPAPARPKTLADGILEVLASADKPLKGYTVARRAGRKNSPHFYFTVSKLMNAGVVVREAEGYRLANA